MLKSTLLIFAGAAIALTPLARAGRAPHQAAAPDAAAAPQAAAPASSTLKNPIVKPTADGQAKAKQLYSIDCAMCHNDNGNGKSDLAGSMGLNLPDFTDPKSLATASDGDLFTLFRNGKDKMPGEDPGRAKDNDIWNLVIYVRNFSKPQTAAK